MVKWAVALTILIDAVDIGMRFVPPWFGDGFDAVIGLLVLSFYPLMALRWTLVLLLMLRKVRVRPFRLLPSAFALQAVVVVAGQTVLGVLSLLGWLAWAISSDTGSHVVGFVFHIALPTMIVFGLARSVSRRARVVQT